MWDFRRSAPKTGARERGQVGDHLPIYVITCNNVAFHHSQCSQSLVWHPFENDVSFPCPLLPFPQTHWGVFLSLEMEGFWPSSTGPNVPRMQWMLNAKTSQLNNTRKDKAYQKILPKMPCQRRYQVWCGWEHVAKRRGPGRLDYIYLYIFILLWVFLFVYSHNKWQLYCIFFLFSCILVFLMSCFKQSLYCSNSVSVFPPFWRAK